MIPHSIQNPVRRHGAALGLLMALVALLGLGLPAQSAAPAHDIYLPLLARPTAGKLLIAAAHIDSARTGEADEAILVWNTGPATVDLAGWTLEANGQRATFPTVGAPLLAPGARLWCAADAAAFRQSFGEPAGCEWAVDGETAAVNLVGRLRLTNSGGTIQLRDPANGVIDALLYGDEAGPLVGWQGPAVQIYARGAIARQGQIWERKRAPQGGAQAALPIDQDLASDWSSDLADVAWGRRVRFPGWLGGDGDAWALPTAIQTTATITVAVAPEGLFAPVAAALARATTTVDLSLYTLEHPELAQIIAAAAQRGVRVRLLLEGGPPGGITDFERWCVRLIAEAGGEVRFLAMQEGAPRGLQPRYRYTHAKYGVIDGQVVLVGSENFGWEAMPVAGASGGAPPGGRRGAYLLVDAPEVAAAFARLFANDWDPARFLDLQPYAAAHPTYGDPPSSFTLPLPLTFDVAAAPFAAPVAAYGPARFVLLVAPEQSMRPDAGLHALLHQAGRGDSIHLVQLYEHKFWGDSTSNVIADPNPRLEMTIAAARRGATVRVLLDSLFDDADALRSNLATVNYLNTLATNEGLDMQAQVGNPTGGGIHSKLLLVRVGGATWTALGSLNGGEVSHKINREVVLMVDQPAVYARLAEVFFHDWAMVTR
jgi:phosphatidylserine/phosphatidylglycerophosphate/cardiolipin synthase-like enzyme